MMNSSTPNWNTVSYQRYAAAVQDERGHAERAQCGERRNTQPELLRGLLAVRPKQHDQHRRNACRQKQVRQRQHINKPDAEKPVRRACASALAQNSAMHISGTSCCLPLTVLRTKCTIGIDISIKA